MKKNKFYLVILILLLFSVSMLRANTNSTCDITSYPHTENFNGNPFSPSGWTLKNLTGGSMGAVGYDGNVSQTSTGGSVALRAYGSLYSMAVMPRVDVPVNSLKLDFYLRGSGTFEVGVMTHPDSLNSYTVVRSWTLSGGGNFNLYQLADFHNYTDTGRYIVFTCRNSNANPVYLDGVTLDIISSCEPVTNLTLDNVGYTLAELSWNGSASNPESYIIKWEETGSGEWSEMTIDSSETYYMISGLEPTTDYTVTIAPVCNEIEGISTTAYFATPCPVGGVISEIAHGTGTTNGDRLPIRNQYQNSYSQQLFLANELEDVELISAIAFQYLDATERASDIEIYLGHTTDTAFSSINDYIALDQLTLVYNRKTTSFSNAGAGNWVTLDFDTYFSYNGSENLVVAVYQSNSYNFTPAESFQTHSTSDNRAIYFAQEHAIPLINPTSVYPRDVMGNRNNIRFHECSADLSCLRPNVLVVSEVTGNSADVSWVEEGGSSTYFLEYKKASDLVWISEGQIASVFYQLQSLSSGTAYEVRVAASCNSGDTTAWLTTTFVTGCGDITELPHTEDFNSYASSANYPTCWTESTMPDGYLATLNRSTTHSSPASLAFNNSAESGKVLAVMPRIDESIQINTLQLDFWARSGNRTDTLNAALLLGFMDDPNDEATFSLLTTINPTRDWTKYEISLQDYSNIGTVGRYIALLMELDSNNLSLFIDDLKLASLTTCTQPDSLVVVSVDHESALINWAEMGTATHWNIEYGLAGYLPDNAIFGEMTNNKPYTITGLSPNTMYDFHVKAECGVSGESESVRITFTTNCMPIDTLPYVESFDHSGTTLPECWYGKSTVNDNFPQVSNTVSSSAPYSIHLYGTRSTYTYIASPAIGGNLNERQIRFKANVQTTATDFRHVNIVVGAIANQSDLSTLVPIDTVSIYENQIWKEVEVNLDNYSGTARHIVLFYHDSYSLFIDDFTIDSLPSCIAPRQMAASEISAEGMTISWIQGEESDWEIEIGAPGFVPGTGNADTIYYVTGNPSCAISELSEITSYDIYVRSICSANDTSSWSSKLSVTTMCEDRITIPYFENFDGMPDGVNAKVQCWGVYTTGVNSWPYISRQTIATNYISAFNVLDFNYITADSNIAIMPAIDPSVAITDLVVSFWIRAANSNQGTFTVGIVDEMSESATFTPLQVVSLNLLDVWERVVVRLDSYTGSGRHIAFKCENAASSASRYYIDDLSIDYYVPCDMPTNLTISGIGQDLATVAWSAGGVETSWIVEYEEVGSGHTLITTTDVQNIVLRQLEPSTLYEVCVRAACEDENSEAACRTFTTDSIPATTFTITATAGDHGTINPQGAISVLQGENETFQFTPETNYKVKSVKINNAEIDTAQYAGNQYTFVNVQSHATIHVDFELITGIAPYILENSITIFPNPAESMLNVKLEMPFETMEITNMLGQVIYATTINDLTFSVNVSQLNAGVYFIKLSSKEGTTTKKFVKN